MNNSNNTPNAINAEPFEDDAAYVTALSQLLGLRVQRILTADRIRETEKEEPTDRKTIGRKRPVALDADRRRLAELQDAEDEMRAEINARREVTEHDLGLDRVVDRLDLTESEAEQVRFPLVAMVLDSIAPPEADAALGTITMGGMCSVNVGDMIRLMDPDGISGWLQFRRLWRPNGPLIRNGEIVSLRFLGDTVEPRELLDAKVQILSAALAEIVGDESLADEGKQPESDSESECDSEEVSS